MQPCQFTILFSAVFGTVSMAMPISDATILEVSLHSESAVFYRAMASS